MRICTANEFRAEMKDKFGDDVFITSIDVRMYDAKTNEPIIVKNDAESVIKYGSETYKLKGSGWLWVYTKSFRGGELFEHACYAAFPYVRSDGQEIYNMIKRFDDSED